MRKKLAKLLRAWADKINPPPLDYDGDWVGCEECQCRVDIAEAIISGDCYLCKPCHTKWFEVAKNCRHDWLPETNELGDHGHICGKCFMWTDAFEPEPAPKPGDAP